MAGIDQNTLWQLASMILGKPKAQPTTRERATFLRTDSDGTQWVRLPSSNDETPVNGRTLATAKAGDTVEWSIDDGRLSITGNSTSPSVGMDYVGQEVSVVTKQINQVKADVIETNELLATKATIGQLEAESARIDDLEADHVSVSDFEAEQANIDSLQAATADIDTIRANSAKVQNLTAAQLEADHAKVGQLDVSQIAADHATIGTLDTTYMHANMSNSDVAWIENGTIKDGAITNAMINSVSANKLTAGTIDASNITVTNLNADNITTGTINGQRIGEGSLSLDKLSEDVYTEAEVDTIVDGLNDRIDGAIETHTGTAVPTLNNAPASSWNTTALRDEHVGDVYYVVNSQSQQNGYCYRFTKSGSTYSWQLIKDSDVTAALSRLTTAEGKITSIESFDSTVSSFMTDTNDELTSIKSRATSLETRMTDAEGDISDKVDTSTFNTLSQTVDTNTASITSLSSTVSQKADGSTVTALTNRVSTVEQDVDGIETSIGELQETVESKADGSTVSTISNRLNTVSDTVDGHTQSITSVQNTLSTKADSSTVSTLSTQVNNVSDTVDGHTSQLSSITSTQTTMQTTLDKTVKSSIQLWYSKANTTAPSKPTSQVTSTSTSGNAWRTVVPAYNASYPHYYYCWQYEYADGTYGWSAVVRDIAMGESQATARTADSNASAAVTTANTASTNASTALTTANTANTNATDAKTTATTASTTASEAKTTAETAASDASTAKTNAASAVSTANSASTTATNAQTTANANIKSSVQLWFTKANSTAPSKPTSVVSTSNANTANAWNLVVPVWNSSYPHYFYCYQQQKGDGNYQWTDVVYDRATSEAQQLANTTSTNLTTLQEDYATYKQTTTENVSSIGTRLTTAEGKISTAETNISQNAQNIELKVSKDGVISSINQSAESVKIQASRVEIDGTAIFSAISSDVDDAITDKGYATTAQAQGYATTAKSEAISTAAADATSKANVAQTAATNAANTATDQKLASYSTTQQMNEAIQDATGPLFYGKENSSGYVHLGHVPYAVGSSANYSHLHLTGRIGGWLSTTSGSIDVTFKSRTDNALYNTVDRRDETIDTSFVDVLVYTGTDGFTHYWIKVNSYWYAQLYAEFEQFVEDDHTLTATEPDGTCVWKLSEHTAVAATKSNAVKRTQRIWYRKSASGAPSTPGTASSNWVTKADDGDNAWTKMHVAISSSAKYIYTCEQYEMADGTVGYTSVLLDNTITVIDGGNIITGSVTANKLNASDINASKTLTVGAMTDAAAATILNSNISVGGRNLFVGSSTGANWSYSTFDPSNVVYTRSTTATAESYVRAPNMTFEAGETYTLSCWAKSNGNVVHMDLYKVHVSGSGSHQSRMSIFLTTEYQKITWTFVCNATSAEVAYIRFDNNGSTTSGTEAILYVREPKLEVGNKATDWTPAPEDVDSAISNAAKTATNYIGIDSTGIRIANANPSTATTYQHLTATNTEFVAGGNTVASFGSTVTLGNAASGSVVTIDSDSLDMMHGTTEMLHFGYGEGAAASGTAVAPYYTIGTRAANSTVGNYSVAEGYNTTASGSTSHAEGYGITASGYASHAEGSDTTASGNNSHAEGYDTTAIGYASHAEGYDTTASGWASHAEGYDLTASGYASHAQNFGTIAASEAQTALGRWNVSDANNTYAVIIGNGIDGSNRSNALTVDWQGNVECAGTINPTATASTVTVNTTNVSASGDNRCWSNGAAVSFIYRFTVKSALASGSPLAVGTLPVDYRPSYDFAVEVYTSNASNVLAMVSTAGVISIRNVGSGSLATTTTIRVSGTFVP